MRLLNLKAVDCELNDDDGEADRLLEERPTEPIPQVLTLSEEPDERPVRP